jgi:hypothetical protein
VPLAVTGFKLGHPIVTLSYQLQRRCTFTLLGGDASGIVQVEVRDHFTDHFSLQSEAITGKSAPANEPRFVLIDCIKHRFKNVRKAAPSERLRDDFAIMGAGAICICMSVPSGWQP